MRKNSFILCVMILIGLMPIAVNAQEMRTYTITVMGEGVISAVPNQVDITVAIEGESPTSQVDAMRQQAVRADQVLGFLRAEGVSEKDITTLSYNFGPQYRYVPQTQRRVFDIYRTTQRLKFRVSRTDGGAIIDGIITRVASIDSVNFVVSNRDELEESAVNLAIADAKARARRRASELGIDLGAILGYQEGAAGLSQPQVFEAALRASGDSAIPSLPAGEAEIRSVVHIVYELIPKR